MTGSLRVVRALSDQPIQIEVYPPDYQIGSEYVAGFQLLRDNVGVALLAFNESGIVLRDVVASTPKEVAFATPPQEFDLSLASGWNNYSGMRSRHWKNQFDEVSVVVDISNANTVSHGAVVATLPEGFRPAAVFDAPAIIYDGSEILPVRAYFSTNGQISISGYSNQTWSKVLFFETQASFVVPS